MPDHADAIIIGAGLSGLVTAAELVEAGKRVVIVEQEPEASSAVRPTGRPAGSSSSTPPSSAGWACTTRHELARQDWFGSAGVRPRRRRLGARMGRGLPRLRRAARSANGCARRASSSSPLSAGPSAVATRPPATATRFRASTSSGAPAPASSSPSSTGSGGRRRGPGELPLPAPRRRADPPRRRDRRRLGPSWRRRRRWPRRAEQPRRDRRVSIGAAIVVASGGIGGNHDLVRKAWPEWLGTPPSACCSGVPAHVDGRHARHRRGGRRAPRQRRPHVALRRGHRELARRSGRSTASGSCPGRRASGSTRPAAPAGAAVPRLRHPSAPFKYLRTTGYDYSWFILDQSIIEKEFALSGSEQNPDLTGKSVRELLRQRLGKGADGAGRGVQGEGRGLRGRRTPRRPVRGHAAALSRGRIRPVEIRHEIEARDRELDHKFTKDAR